MAMGRVLLFVVLLGWVGVASAVDQCPLLRQQQSAERGRHPHRRRGLRRAPALATAGPRKVGSPAGRYGRAKRAGWRRVGPWRQVARYWQEAGLLQPHGCRRRQRLQLLQVTNPAYPGLGCRGFVIDTPWSAAFVFLGDGAPACPRSARPPGISTTSALRARDLWGKSLCRFPRSDGDGACHRATCLR